MIAVVFQFEVKPGREDEFEQLHGADGEWTGLSRQSRSFIGASFLREFTASPRYLLVEYWSEMVVYERHRKDFAGEVPPVVVSEKDDRPAPTVEKAKEPFPPAVVFTMLIVPVAGASRVFVNVQVTISPTARSMVAALPGRLVVVPPEGSTQERAVRSQPAGTTSVTV